MDSPNLDSSAPSWKNWAASCAASPARIVRPENEAQAVDLVREALEEETSIRVAGAGHSFSSLVPTDGMLIDTELLRGITELDQDRKRARMKAGTRLNTLGEPLWDAGFALHNQGDIDRQSIAGAVATATHGSGIQLGSFSSQLTWARLINGEGQVVEVDESDQQTLRALQTSLGTFGMLLEVEIQLVDRYLLEEQITYPLWAETMSSWDSDVRENRHYSIQWCPYADSGEVFGLTPPNEGTLANRSFTKKYRLLSPNETHVPRPGTRIDHSYKIYPGEYEVPYREMEYFVDARYGLEATSAVQELLLRQFPEERHPIEVRWVKAENAFLSPAHERDSAVISVCSEPGSNYLPYFHEVHRLLAGFNARGHWGKTHFFERAELESLYPKFEEFNELRRRFDPRGLFLNDLTRQYFG